MAKRLTLQQQKLVEENYGLIPFFARNKNLDLEEYHGALALGLIDAARTYDVEHGAAFSTYAAVTMMNRVRMKMRKDRRAIQAISLDTPVGSNDDNVTLADFVKDPIDSVQAVEHTMVVEAAMEFVSKNMHEPAATIARLQAEGLTQNEIAARYGRSQVWVSKQLHKEYKRMKAILDGRGFSRVL